MDIARNIFTNLPDRISGLGDIAANLWWSWHPESRMLFKTINRQAWKESLHNPVKMLSELPTEVLLRFSKDPEYLRYYDVVTAKFRKEIMEKKCSILNRPVDIETHRIAYFSAEYGLHHSLPFYAGGLGFLAGDFVKECSDQMIPLTAIGFMYPEGYLYQRIREDGWQENPEQPLDRDAASIYRVMDNGNQLLVKIPLIEPEVYVAVWKIAVGRICLYLMDTDIEINDPWNREISSRLYTGDIEQRLRQEIVLGIGGSEVLEKLGIKHSVLHLNEGHPAFAILERIRDHVVEGMSFDEAAKQVRETTVFTTHTPVPAGHDVFPFRLMEKYFRSYWSSLGLNHDQFMKLGVHPEHPNAGFNMTAFAMRSSEYRNCVSLQHQKVTRRMWKSLWPGTSEPDIPIDYVTNGVHVPKWIEPKIHLLFNRYLGPDWLDDHDDSYVWELIEEIPDDELWKTHYWLKIKLIDAVREQTRRRWKWDRVSPSMLVTGGTFLDPSVLTIGFARRFATYKRADLILNDVARLKKLLNDRWKPIQIIFAGKAHPADDPGKRILQRIFNAARDPEMGGRIAFVEDYGEQFAQYMVHGVDVWLNNPMPPMEACGTSGMKAALNGVPHLSVCDGWWMEGYNGKNGWAFGDYSENENRDAKDAAQIYNLLETQIIPAYYSVSDKGIHHEWVRIMKESIKSCAPRFSARRMVKEYSKKFYSKAIATFSG